MLFKRGSRPDELSRSAQQHPEPTLAQPESELIPATVGWLKREGVPHFVPDHRPYKQAPYLLVLLFLVSAFQVGVAPYLGLSTFELMLVPIPIAVGAYFFRRRFTTFLTNPEARPRWRPYVVPILPALPLVAVYVLATFRAPVAAPEQAELEWLLRPEPWVNFSTLLSAFVATVVLLEASPWYRPGLGRWRFALLGVLSVAVLAALLEGTLVPRYRDWLAVGVDAAVPAMALMTVIFFVSLKLAQRSGGAPGIGNVAMSVPYPVIPILILWLGIDNAVVSRLLNGWPEVVGLFGMVMLILVIMKVVQGVPWRRRASAETPEEPVGTAPRAEALTPRAVIIWIGSFLVGYPAWILLTSAVPDMGLPASSSSPPYLQVLAVNLGWLVLMWLVVVYRGYRIVPWALRQAWSHVWDYAAGLSRGLPMILLFTAFFVLAAEVWQVLTRAEQWQFWTLIAVILALNLVVLAFASFAEAQDANAFAHWSDVVAAIRPKDRAHWFAWTKDRAERRNSTLNELVAAVEHRSPAWGEPAPPPLRRGERSNAALVVVCYETVVLLLAGTALVFVLYAVERLIVPADVAAQWVLGDSATPPQIDAFPNDDGGSGSPLKLDLPVWPDPWWRVAILLGVFGMLQLSVAVLADPAQRSAFLSNADQLLASRLAVRMVLRLLQRDSRSPHTPGVPSLTFLSCRAEGVKAGARASS